MAVNFHRGCLKQTHSYIIRWTTPTNQFLLWRWKHKQIESGLPGLHLILHTNEVKNVFVFTSSCLIHPLMHDKHFKYFTFNPSCCQEMCANYQQLRRTAWRKMINAKFPSVSFKFSLMIRPRPNGSQKIIFYAKQHFRMSLFFSIIFWASTFYCVFLFITLSLITDKDKYWKKNCRQSEATRILSSLSESGMWQNSKPANNLSFSHKQTDVPLVNVFQKQDWGVAGGASSTTNHEIIIDSEFGLLCQS